MEVKSWTIRTLKDRLKYYKNLLEICKDDNEREKLSFTIKRLEDFIKDEQRSINQYDYEHIAKIDQEQASHYSIFLPIILDTNRYIIRNNIVLNDQLIYVNTTEDLLLRATYDFYQRINGIFKEKLDEYCIYNNMYITFSDDEYFAAYIRKLPHYPEFYMKLNQFNSVYDIASTIHDFGHGIAASINENHFNNSILGEVEGIFFELVYLDSIDEKDYSKEIILNSKHASILYYNKCCYNIYGKHLTSLNGINDKEEAETILNNNGVDEFDAKEIMSTSLENYTDSAISFLIAVELLYIYKRNEYAALKILTDIININTNKQKEIINIINNMGITLGKNIPKFYRTYLKINEASKSFH